MATVPSHSIFLLQGAQSYFGQGHWPYAMQQVRHTLPAVHALTLLEGGPALFVCMGLSFVATVKAPNEHSPGCAGCF